MTDVHALSGAYAIDALDDDERRRFEDHLAACDECRLEVAGLQEAGVALSSVAPLTPPEALRARVLADVAAVRPLPPLVGPAEQPAPAAHRGDEVADLGAHRERRRPRLATVLAGAAAAVVVAGVGVTAVVQSVGDEPGAPVVGAPVPTVTPATVDAVVDADDAETHARAVESGGSITAVRSREVDRAVVVAQNLDQLPPSKVYELWLRLDGEMVPAGLMSVTDGAVLLDGEAADAEAIGVTVEDAGGAPDGVPTTQPIAYFPLEQA